MLVFAGFMPHSPILLPFIGKDNLIKARKTTVALEQLFEAIGLKNIETLILLYVPKNTEVRDEKIAINIEPKARITLEAVGDLTDKFEFSADIGLGHRLKEIVETKIPVDLVSRKIDDYGIALPLCYLQNLKSASNVRVLPVSISSNFNKESLYVFGKHIKEKLFSLNNRYGVLAVGDLAHGLNEEKKISSAGIKFDNFIVSAIKSKNLQAGLKIDDELIKKAQQSAYNPFLVLSGILDEIRFDLSILSYEHPFGAGFLVAHFSLS